MPFAIRPPTLTQAQALLAQAARSTVSYTAVGATRDERNVPGYHHDHVRVCVGRGARDFETACRALRAWVMFPASFTRVYPPHAPIVEGANVLVTIQVLGLHWHTTSRIVYVVDDVTHFGFAYGTLAEHVEEGEERFLVEHQADDTVWYDLCAFSKPRHWMVRLGYPVARLYQQRFRTESCAAVLEFVQKYS